MLAIKKHLELKEHSSSNCRCYLLKLSYIEFKEEPILNPSNYSLRTLSANTSNRILYRNDLFQKIDKYLQTSGSWIFGASGTGKTTLISTYLQRRKLQSIILKADTFGSDVETFLKTMSRAMEKSGLIAKSTIPAITCREISQSKISAHGRFYFNKLYSQINTQAVLVFDNLEKIDDGSPILIVLQNALEIAPEHVHLIFSSRRKPGKQFTRLEVNGRLATIDWRFLRFSIEETHALASKMSGEKMAANSIERIHRKTGGWPAAIQMLLQSMPTSSAVTLEFDSYSQNIIYDYIEAELFDPLPESDKNILLQTCIVPTVSPKLVEKLTGDTLAIITFERLYRDQLLIEKKATAEYEFNPLFRDFLLNKIQHNIMQNKLQSMIFTAANVISETTQIIEVVNFLRKLEGHIEIESILSGLLKILLVRGDVDSAKEILTVLPSRMVASDPWTQLAALYNQSASEPNKHLLDLQRCFSGFSETKDEDGKLIILSEFFKTALSSVALVTRKNIKMLLENLNKLDLQKTMRSQEIAQAKLIKNAFCLMALRKFDRKLLKKLERHCSTMLHKCMSSNTKKIIARNLAWKDLVFGNLYSAKFYFNMSNSYNEQEKHSHRWQIDTSLWESLYFWMTGRFEDSYKTGHEGFLMACKNGFPHSSFLLQCILAACDFCDQKLARSEKTLREIKKSELIIGGLHIFFYHALAFWHALLCNQRPLMEIHSKMAQNHVKKSDSCFAYAAYYVLKSIASYQKAKLSDAKAQTRIAVKLSRQSGIKFLQFSSHLISAQSSLSDEESTTSLPFLKKAFFLGKKSGYFNAWLWQDQSMACLLSKALKSGIEVEYAQQLIRKHQIVNDSEHAGGKHWPYPIRIYALNRFGLIIHGEPVYFSSRATSPLLLLKSLITIGKNKCILKDDLLTAIWPHVEREKALTNIKITLHRLRKKLRHHNAIIASKGKLKLNADICWVDTWAIEKLLTDVEKEWNKQATGCGSPIKAVQMTRQLMQKMTPRFIPEVDDKWAFSYRKQLNRRFFNCLKPLGAFFEKSNNWMDASIIYSKGMAHLPEEISFYEQLIHCYHQCGLRSMAISTYNLYRKKIADIGLDDQSNSTALYKNILAPPQGQNQAVGVHND